ncbi:DUF4326 domain-containing protein [Nocardioides pyridinolyticus]
MGRTRWPGACRSPWRTYGALAGRDLACWCRRDLPCHADVLLEVADQPLR